MLIKNVHLADKQGLWQILIEGDKIARICPNEEKVEYSGDILDGGNGIAYPPFVEPHIHLDATQTAGQPNWNRSGTLFEGIERWAERKSMLSHEDVKERAWKTLKWQIANGIQHVRTHVDVSDPTLTALKAMLEVKKEVAPWVDVQIVAF
ncbi:MAG TPA: cytosine deaminase, partial [Pasteurellaceae bacterium]|nr:cytosine deaminase [Pasteurellaceae bacterium]